MTKEHQYQRFNNYISLPEYFAGASAAKRRHYAAPGVQRLLASFYRLSRAESVLRVTSECVPVFPPEIIERFAVLLDASKSVARSINDLREATSSSGPNFWDVGGTEWLTLKEARKNGYFDGFHSEGTGRNRSTRASVRATLAYVQKSFTLPKGRRVYVFPEQQISLTRQEYPGWMLSLAIHLHDCNQLEREASRAR